MSYKIQKHITKVNKGATGANKPEWIVFHFVGAKGQAWDNANYFYDTYRGASAHYFIDHKGIVQVVEDNTPAWHVGDGSRSGQGQYNGYKGYGATNNNAIGIENALDVNSHSDVWHMRFHPETLKRSEWLIKKLQKKYNIPDERVIRHFDVSGKLCPGNWQYNNWQQWWEFKAKLEGIAGNKPTGGTSTNDGKPTVNAKTYLVKTGDTLFKIAKDHGVTVAQMQSWNNLADPTLIFPETYLFVAEPKEEVKPVTDIDKLARETIAGKHGNGEARKKSLGNNYSKVMQRVNELLGVVSKPTPKPQAKSIDTLVKETLAGKHGNGDDRKKSLGSNYQAVMDVINGETTVKAPTKSIDTLVKETLAGKYGNGEARKKSLGSNYQAVMDVINGKTTVNKNKVVTKQVVDDVIAGKYGNGTDREKRLRNAGYDPQAVQREVNKRY